MEFTYIFKHYREKKSISADLPVCCKLNIFYKDLNLLFGQQIKVKVDFSNSLLHKVFVSGQVQRKTVKGNIWLDKTIDILLKGTWIISKVDDQILSLSRENQKYFSEKLFSYALIISSGFGKSATLV